MPEIVSHGTWSRGPDVVHGGTRFMSFGRRPDGVDWYQHAHAHLADTRTRKVLVRDGIAVMVERDGTRIVPPGEVLEVGDEVAVEREWRWADGHFAPMPEIPEDPLGKLVAFLAAHPDVRALLG